MDCTAERIAYHKTGFFSSIVNDYLSDANALRSFYAHRPDIEGVKAAIAARQAFSTNREALVKGLQQQYAGMSLSVETEKNITALLDPKTFTITTAHQPNIFTGPLYFIYKIFHAIRLAESCKTWFPEYDFVPVYFMGSEDADLDELGHFYIAGEKYNWETKQAGAVGRMKIDKALLKLVADIEGRVGVWPKGGEIVSLVKEFYKEGVTIQQATTELVNALFGKYGLVILIPDNPVFKKELISVFEDDILRQTGVDIVNKTGHQLELAGYKVQAHPRDINLFYLGDGIRNRIEKVDDRYNVVDTDISFSKEELLKDLQEHPEHFSPNVILRGIFQETVLPNIAFTGGGGELAYWLQLKPLFEHYKVPYPILLVRNSFLFIDKVSGERIQKMGLEKKQLFLNKELLLQWLVKRDTNNNLSLKESYQSLNKLYEELQQQASAVDTTLNKHVGALRLQAYHKLERLEKKMLRAEKRQFSDHQRQLDSIKDHLFPHNNLQERIENFIPFYAQWGEDWMQEVYANSLALEQEMVILNLKI